MAPPGDAPPPAWSRRERPWLIPSNRKLRHLHAITLRNLSLAPDGGTRPRRQTIDDEGLPATTKSPAKLLALRELAGSGHSKSSDDLRPLHDVAQPKQRTPPRPRAARMRRRSTLEWTAATSQQRQRKLEDLSAQRMADMFYSLHLHPDQDPVYVSEVAERQMNPNFRNVRLDPCGPHVTRLDSLTVKFWAKSDNMAHYCLLVDLTLSLACLQFIGKSLSSFRHPFPPNCVVFQLTDGFYACFTDARVQPPLDPFRDGPAKTSSARPLPTSSFDALLRLSKLDDSLQDALALRRQLAAELEDTLRENKLPLDEKIQLEETSDFLKTIDFATATVKKQLRALEKKRDEKRDALRNRRDLLTRDREARTGALGRIESSKPSLKALAEKHSSVKSDIFQQRRRVADDISKVYPIAPLPDRSLAFTIRDLHLPNSEDLDSASPDTLSAALGHVSHVVQLLSLYLGLVLPYPLVPRSSTSTISDPVSTMTASKNPSSPFGPAANSANSAARTFPLFAKGAVRFRFEYGVFLLNKDIELLLSTHFGVRVLDIRQTLTNLLYAVYCATAGEGELPARKAGGVRALLRAGGAGSRNGSFDDAR